MKCPTCRRQPDHDVTGVCTDCQIRTGRQLHDIRASWYKAHGELLPGVGGTGGTSNEPKIGVNVAALSWVNGAPLLGVLGEWEKLIREERGLVRVGSVPALGLSDEIDRITRFHLAHLDWATNQPWADEFVIEIRDLHGQGQSACRESGNTGMRIDCPGEVEEGGICGRRLNIPTDPESTVYCKQCHTTWDQRRLAAVAMSVAEVEVMLPIAEVAHLTGVTVHTIRRWVREGLVERRGQYVSLKDIKTNAS